MWKERTGMTCNRIVTLMAVDRSPKPQIEVEDARDWVDNLRGVMTEWKNARRN